MDRQYWYKAEDYLEAKRKVDLRCLNRHVLGVFKKRLEGMRDPVLIDLGTGTGLMVRKVASMRLKGNVRIIGLDLDEESCTAAVNIIARDLVSSGYRDCSEKYNRDETGLCGSMQFEREGCRLFIEMRTGDVLSPEMPWHPGCHTVDAVTANAFIDLVPLHDIVSVAGRMLKPGGLFYTTINYDGVTTLLPLSRDEDFETELLGIYNRSMELRRSRGGMTGGSRTGSRLYGELLEQGFSIAAWGSSDWTVVPKEGRYKPGEWAFVRAILHMIYREGVNSRHLPREGLDRWLSERVEALEERRLSFMNHQIDALAQRPQDSESAAQSGK
jgi:SAM-dependent methyltransferase